MHSEKERSRDGDGDERGGETLFTNVTIRPRSRAKSLTSQLYFGSRKRSPISRSNDVMNDKG